MKTQVLQYASLAMANKTLDKIMKTLGTVVLIWIVLFLLVAMIGK